MAKIIKIQRSFITINIYYLQIGDEYYKQHEFNVCFELFRRANSVLKKRTFMDCKPLVDQTDQPVQVKNRF